MCALQEPIKSVALVVQDKAVKANEASPRKIVKQLEQIRASQQKQVQEFGKQLLHERVVERGTGNASKGNRT